MDEVLNTNKFHILLFQEPWVDPNTLKIPHHPEWHDIMTYDYSASDLDLKVQTCIYVS